ncbi:hypothetical protein X773_11840 [Mesorhizobium sp. LSJC285A00]|nr:hypothetical protein X773_11840 [Mesorhizobium sp. LSJC285A00]
MGVHIRELAAEILDVKPADGSTVAIEQTVAREHEAAGAECRQRHALFGRPQQEGLLFGAEAAVGVEQADHDDIVELLRIADRLGRQQLDTATRPDRQATLADDLPVELDPAAAVAFIAGQPQRVDEQRQRRQREVANQEKRKPPGHCCSETVPSGGWSLVAEDWHGLEHHAPQDWPPDVGDEIDDLSVQPVGHLFSNVSRIGPKEL